MTLSDDFSQNHRCGIFKAMKRAKRRYRRTFIREWREYRELTIEQVANRIDMTTSNLSKIERGVQPYTQPILEGLAHALNTSKANLLDHKPGTEDEDVGSALAELDAEARARALGFIAALKGSRAA